MNAPPTTDHAPTRASRPTSRWLASLETVRWLFEQPVAVGLVLAISLSGTVLAWRLTQQSVERDAFAIFDRNTRQITDALRARLTVAEVLLRSSAAHLAASTDVNVAEWSEFDRRARLNTTCEPLLETVYAPGVWSTAGVLTQAPLRLFTEGSPARAEWHERDLFEWPGARAASEHAAATGKMVLFGPVKVPARDTTAMVAVLAVPEEGVSGVVRSTARPARGFVVAPLCLLTLLEEFAALAAPGLQYRLRGPAGELVELRPMPSPPDGAAGLRTTAEVKIGEQPWQLEFFVTPEFARNVSAGSPVVVLVGGAVLTLLLGLILYGSVSSRRRALRLAQEMTLDLWSTTNRLQLILDRVPEAVSVVARDGRITEMSRAGHAMFGLPPGETAVPPEARACVHPEDWPMVQSVLLTVFRGSPQATRFRTPEVNGRVRWIDAQAVPLTVEQGVVSSVLTVSRDVTELQAAEEKLRVSEYNLRQAQRLGQIGSWVLTLPDLQFTGSEQLRRIFGLSLEHEPTAEQLLERLLPQDLARVRQQGDQPWESLNGHVAELHLRPTGEEERIILQQIEVVSGPDGRAARVMGVVQEITEQKRAEQARLALYDALQKAQKMEAVGTLAGGIAHDFNNILAGILCYTALLKQDVAGQAKAEENVEEIERASLRARDLIRQILTYSRRQGGERQPTRVQPEIEEVLKLLRSTLSKRLELRADLRCPAAVVAMEPVHIHQIMLNLVTNAADAMEQKGVVDIVVEVVDSAEQKSRGRAVVVSPAGCLRLRVTDHGPGMERAVVDRIFEPYFTTKVAGKGTGLGLPVVRGIVEDHQGSIVVSTEPGQGSVFEVLLPLVDQVCPPPVLATVRPPRGQGQRILLVEDEAPLLRAQQRYLDGLGYRVTACDSSRQAREAFAQAPSRFDLIITDHAMPELSGLELVEALRQLRRDVPVLLTTGYAPEEVRQLAADLRIAEVLNKPVAAEQLAAAVQRVFAAVGAASKSPSTGPANPDNPLRTKS